MDSNLPPLNIPNSLPFLSLGSAPPSPTLDACIKCNKLKDEIRSLQLQLNNVLAQLNVLTNPQIDTKTVLHRHSSR